MNVSINGKRNVFELINRNVKVLNIEEALPPEDGVDVAYCKCLTRR